MKLKGISSAILAAIIFGFSPILSIQTYNLGSTPETTIFYRHLFVIAILFVVMIVKKVSFRISFRNLLIISFCGIIGFGVASILLLTSYKSLGAGTATTLHFLYPVFIALICYLFFKEHFGIQKVMSLISATIGIIFFMDQYHNTNIAGAIMAVTSGLAYALFIVGLDKFKLVEMNAIKVSFYISIAVSIGMLLYDIPVQKIVYILQPKAYLYIFLISISAFTVAVILLQIGIKYLGVTTVSVFCLFEPITGILFGALLLREVITPRKILGCIFVLAAVLTLLFKSHKDSIRTQKKNSETTDA